jgi:hypothetical protein
MNNLLKIITLDTDIYKDFGEPAIKCTCKCKCCSGCTNADPPPSIDNNTTQTHLLDVYYLNNNHHTKQWTVKTKGDRILYIEIEDNRYKPVDLSTEYNLIFHAKITNDSHKELQIKIPKSEYTYFVGSVKHYTNFVEQHNQMFTYENNRVCLNY